MVQKLENKAMISLSIDEAGFYDIMNYARQLDDCNPKLRARIVERARAKEGNSDFPYSMTPITGLAEELQRIWSQPYLAEGYFTNPSKDLFMASITAYLFERERQKNLEQVSQWMQNYHLN
jgi:hypothetical protein